MSRFSAVLLSVSLGLLLGEPTEASDEFDTLAERDAPWLARALAATDPDVDAAIEAYEANDLEQALERIDAAIARRGERPELAYDRGLILLAQGDDEGALKEFGRALESAHLGVRASAHYELGNMAMIAEDWEGAIAAYIAALRVDPTHENAKWNLELALERKREQEEEEEKEDQENEDQENEDQENQDQENQDQENEDQENEDQENEDQENQDQENEDQENQDPGEQDPGEQDPGEQEQEQQEQEQQEQREQEQQDQAAQAQEIDSSDIDRALEELDRQDTFSFGRPRGGKNAEIKRDW